MSQRTEAHRTMIHHAEDLAERAQRSCHLITELVSELRELTNHMRNSDQAEQGMGMIGEYLEKLMQHDVEYQKERAEMHIEVMRIAQKAVNHRRETKSTMNEILERLARLERRNGNGHKNGNGGKK